MLLGRREDQIEERVVVGLRRKAISSPKNGFHQETKRRPPKRMGVPAGCARSELANTMILGLQQDSCRENPAVGELALVAGS